jgi:hypothetical protein
MAYKVMQEFKFENVEYSYDRRGDVLDISFGPPAPAIALQFEDWLAIRLRLNPPSLQGMTIVGFKSILEKINRYAEQELPKRMRRLARVVMSIAYDDESDTLVIRWNEELNALQKLLQNLPLRKAGKLSIFEPLTGRTAPPMSLAEPVENVYVEKSLPSKDIVGMKILQYTKYGEAALQGIIGAIIDTVFEPTAEHDENVHLIANKLIQRLDWQRFAALTA